MTRSIVIVLSSLAFSTRSITTGAFTLRSTVASGLPAYTQRTALLDMKNPLQSLFQNIQRPDITSLSTEQRDRLISATSAVSMSSWDDIRTILSSQQSWEEKDFRKTLERGIGIGSPLHKLRLFEEGNKEENVRVTLFRDSASWCPYCQKVWMTLEQKRIPYKIEKINMRCYGDKPSSFTRMQPSGAIPVAIIDGVTYRQSNDIIFALEEKFPEESMIFGDQNKIRDLLGLERKIFGAWMYWLTSHDRNGGLKEGFVSTLFEVEKELQRVNGFGFFLDDKVSVVDFMFAPFLERMAASMVYFKGFKIRVAPGEQTDFPYVNRWFDAMETLPSYQLTKSDYYTHCWDLPPQLGGCVAESGAEPFQNAINGRTPGSWSLPLTQHNGGVEPDWAWAGDTNTSRREAVERVSANHEAIVAFACRGAGREGFPQYGALLSDPNAVSNEAVQPLVDAVLRITCCKLLSEDTEDYDAAMNAVKSVWMNEGGDEVIHQVIKSLEYMRDRVGVPRDMKMPAARQLRAHVNWAIDELSK